MAKTKKEKLTVDGEYQVVKVGADPKNRIVEIIHVPENDFWGIRKMHYVFESGNKKQAELDFDFYVSCSQSYY